MKWKCLRPENDLSSIFWTDLNSTAENDELDINQTDCFSLSSSYLYSNDGRMADNLTVSDWVPNQYRKTVLALVCTPAKSYLNVTKIEATKLEETKTELIAFLSLIFIFPILYSAAVFCFRVKRDKIGKSKKRKITPTSLPGSILSDTNRPDRIF